jgi:hypothetical protein
MNREITVSDDAAMLWSANGHAASPNGTHAAHGAQPHRQIWVRRPERPVRSRFASRLSDGRGANGLVESVPLDGEHGTLQRTPRATANE